MANWERSIECLHFLFFGISGSFRRRRSMVPGKNGSELVRSKIDACLEVAVVGNTVRRPSPISSSSALLLLAVNGFKFNTNFG